MHGETALKEGKSFSQGFRVEKAFKLGFKNVDLGMIGSPNKIQDA